jgi:HEPN domain-containing protein
MNPLTVEWIEKASADLATAGREMRARRDPNYDAVCFHAQQCVEKLLKAALTECGRDFSRTHDLNHLLNLILTVNPLWDVFRPGFQELVAYAVEYRYPGENSDKEMARAALNTAKAFSAEFFNKYGGEGNEE